MADEPVHETKTEARAGYTPGVVRWVLLASLILIVIAFTIIVAVGQR